MNKELLRLGRDWIKVEVATFTPSAQVTFRKIFGRKNGARSLEDALAMSIDSVVDEITPENLSPAMDLIHRTQAAAKEGTKQ